MPFAHKLKEASQPETIIALLNQLLANTIDFKLSAKQAHWNVRGTNFIALHELFDKVSSTVDEYADTLAERVAQLNGTAQGTLQTVSEQSVLPGYPLDIHEAQDHVRALSTTIGMLADTHRQAINTSTNAGDKVTADILTETARGLDKLHWFIRSHHNS
jgi:starvation-inducible DNA-binding protein